MATLLLPLNSCHSLSPIAFQRRNSNFTSLKINNTHHASTSTFPSSSKPSPRFSLAIRASEEDSNPQTLQGSLSLSRQGLRNLFFTVHISSDGEVNNLGVKAALSLLRFYKREISPILPRSCRYVPTCSEYSMEAYKRYGVLKGTVLTTWRLCRCNPLGGSGYDPPRWFGEIRPQEEEVDD